VKRTCIFVDATMFDPDGPGFVPAVVTEGEPGYAPLTGRDALARPWFWGPTIDDAERMAVDYNASLGLTPDDVRDIVLSSMTASWVEEG
jgi:hypothetical protein